MNNSNYTCAVIGVGATVNSNGVKGGGHQIGYTHARMYHNEPRARLVAAADINAENLAAFNTQFEVPHGFADYREMYEKAKPDVVSICTYVGLHKQMIVDAARAGVKAVICEKPFVSTPAELHEIDAVVKETGLKLVLAHIRRYRPAFERARELYTNGSLGQPMLCAAGIAGWDLSEWGSHWMDIFRFFHDDAPIAWVMGQARVRDARGYGHAMEDHGVVTWAFEGGGRGMLDGGHDLAGPWSMTLVGTEGTVRIRGEGELVIDDTAGRRTETFEMNGDKLWSDLLAGLLDWVEGGPEPTCGYGHTRGTAELNLASYVSMLRGDRIDLPLGLEPDIDQWPVNLLADRQR